MIRLADVSHAAFAARKGDCVIPSPMGPGNCSMVILRIKLDLDHGFGAYGRYKTSVLKRFFSQSHCANSRNDSC